MKLVYLHYDPLTPDWCAHWPKSYEESSDFDWESEFNF